MTHHKRPDVQKRLARIEGHIKGIRRMVEDYTIQTNANMKGKEVVNELRETVSKLF